MSEDATRLYHASPVQGLTRLVPRVGTHGQNWVYATDDLAVAAVFLGRLGGDFTCASGIYDGVPYLCERFAGALERRYGSACGSVYIVPGENFRAGQTSYSKDFVSSEAVEPFDEIKVDDARDYLLRLAAEGRILVKFYPERFCIAKDDEDLVEKAVRMCRQSGEEVLEQVKDFHPQLLGRVVEAIAKEQR